ncbi:hypothetical protein HPB49_020593 [Dermacentor silvarum]|uniref:Uncharacterized protein n=1 Tax=Dermacentor silvarum TaxID=543639 RepID=A0ACB8DR70_DERSI|nr:hypothetical protein HPB49_020593 [Dermacentor silvarum]
MYAAAAPKRHRRRKLKFKLSFGSESSGPSNLPSNMKPSPTELFALHTLRQKPNEGERPCDVARNAREAATSKPYVNGELLTIPRTTSSSDSSKPFERKQYEARASDVVKNQTNLIGEEHVIVREKPEPKALTESNVEDVVKQLREFLQENGPSQEEDLLKALSPSKAQQIIEVDSMLTIFLDLPLGFGVLHEHLCSFIYYQHPDDEDNECDCSSLAHGGASTRSCSASTYASGRQYAVARDDESRSARASSPSSTYHWPTADGDDREQEKQRTKNGWTQVRSLPQWESRALQAVQQTYDAEAQTHGWDPARFTELQSKPIKCDAECAELKERLRTLQESHVLEAEQLHVKIEKLRKETPHATTAECGGGNEQPTRHERAEAHWHEWGARPSNPAASTATTASEVSTPRPTPQEEEVEVQAVVRLGKQRSQ